MNWNFVVSSRMQKFHLENVLCQWPMEFYHFLFLNFFCFFSSLKIFLLFWMWKNLIGLLFMYWHELARIIWNGNVFHCRKFWCVCELGYILMDFFFFDWKLKHFFIFILIFPLWRHDGEEKKYRFVCVNRMRKKIVNLKWKKKKCFFFQRLNCVSNGIYWIEYVCASFGYYFFSPLIHFTVSFTRILSNVNLCFIALHTSIGMMHRHFWFFFSFSLFFFFLFFVPSFGFRCDHCVWNTIHWVYMFKIDTQNNYTATVIVASHNCCKNRNEKKKKRRKMFVQLQISSCAKLVHTHKRTKRKK